MIEAQQAVKGIKKQHLVELRSLNNPPAPVKLALEAICLLLGEATSDWKTLRSIIVRENFIPTIVNFTTEDITDQVRRQLAILAILLEHPFQCNLTQVREQMINKYLANADYNFDKVNRASVACGPLVKWAIAQVNYADMLKRVEPLRNELKSLETRANVNKARGDETTSLIAHLEKSIASYKEEYALLISQAQAIKTDLENVQAKVGTRRVATGRHRRGLTEEVSCRWTAPSGCSSRWASRRSAGRRPARRSAPKCRPSSATRSSRPPSSPTPATLTSSTATASSAAGAPTSRCGPCSVKPITNP